jgi:hypothetical protein
VCQLIGLLVLVAGKHPDNPRLTMLKLNLAL